MENIKKHYRYLLPMLVLPFGYGQAANLIILAQVNTLGSFSTAAFSVARSLLSMLASSLSWLALGGLVLSAIQAEAGKPEKAKALHRTFLVLFCALIVLAGAAFLLFGAQLSRLFASPDEIIELSASFLKGSALAMVGMALIAFLIGQFQKSYSLKTALAFGFVMLGMWTAMSFVLTQQLDMGILGLGLCQGGAFAASQIAPFLLIPLRSYTKEFLPAAAGETA